MVSGLWYLGLAEIKLKSSSCNTFLKLSNYCRKVDSDFDLNERFRSYGVDGAELGLGGLGIQRKLEKRGLGF